LDTDQADPSSKRSEFQLLNEAAEFIKQKLSGAATAKILVIAGSGLGGYVKSLRVVEELEYSGIPGIGGSTVAGHAGRLQLATSRSNQTPILVMSGRRHIYEGLTAAEAALLPRAVLLAFPEIRQVIVSNAAGGLDPMLEVGDLMLITDQVNWMFKNPLVGPNRDDMGPRFPDVCDIYTQELRQVALDVAREQGIAIRQGIYVAMHGPSYETRAEVAMLRYLVGADAVGMSTVPEALIAAHAGRQVLGISFISNTLTVPAVTTHQEVVENARLVEERFSTLITAVVERLHH